ncbi:MAG: hypothetical protein DRP83_08500 [Planctomycetota bacterium]|nr:MAG: hypothetical protein DRP83_08500 [Planctomycetota bacterium]
MMADRRKISFLSRPPLVWALLLLIVALQVGCVPDSNGDTGTGPRAKLPDIPPLGGRQASAVRIPYVIRIQMGTIQVPAGLISSSEELWSYLDEEPVSMQSVVLGLNGLRVGLGRASAWGDVERILKKMTAQVYTTSTIQTFSGKPVQVAVKANQPAQTVCVFRQDMTLWGADYPPGDNILAISCTLDEDDRTRLILSAVPQIRTTKRFTRYVRKHGQAQAVTMPKLYSFQDMRFQLPLRSGEFLVIGPGIESRRLTSLAHRFLTKTIAGIEHETVLILRPQIYRINYEE